MFNQIDRLLIIGYFKSYFICLISLLSLYVVVDLFMNLEDFAHHGDTLSAVLTHIAIYYGYRITNIYDRLSEAIVLLAAMFTVAWMQHSNELIPLLSAGVSTKRVVRPVLLSACFMMTITVLNQEFVIPRISAELMADKDDPQGEKEVPVQGAFEPNGIHIEGGTGTRRTMVVKPFFCLIPEGLARNTVHLTAQEARYMPPGEGERGGGWLMIDTQPDKNLEDWDNPQLLEKIDTDKFFLHTREVDFDVVTRTGKWYNFASTLGLYKELQKPDSTRLATLAVLFHTRLTRPILGIILVFLGLSRILRDQNRNVFISAGECVVLCGLFFASFFVCKSLGDNDIISPALAAWLPVLFFGPLAFAMFDAVHT
jgi:lipopolysaccharide export system permease protein